MKQFEAPARAPDAARFCDGLKFNRFHALLISLCIVTLLFDGYYSQIISYVIPGMTRQWQLTPMQAGYVGSYGLVGLMIGAVALGILGDRMGRKIPLMLGLFLFSFFGGLLYWAPDFSTFCILRFLSGLGVGGVLTLTITLATEFAPSNIRATMVTTMVTGLMLGPFFAGLISIVLVPAYGWRIVLLPAFIPLLLLPALHLYMPESIRYLAQKGHYDKAIKELRRLEKAAGVAPIEWTKESFASSATRAAGIKHLFTPALAVMTILIWIVYFCNLLVIYGVTYWLPTLLVASGIPLVKSYAYTSLNHLGGAAGSVVIGIVMDKFGRKTGLVYGYILAAISVWFLGLLPGSPIFLYLVIAAAGFFVTGSQSAQHAVAGEIYPTFARSTGVGWALTIGRFGAVCGPLLGGVLQEKGYSFSQYFAINALPCLLCALIVLFYRINVKGEALETVEAKLTSTH